MSDTTTRRYVSCADTAKLIRAQLKRQFPGVKFSVRSSTYAGGASIDVRWADGPPEPAVAAITGTYGGKRFDGMIDLAYGAEHWLLPDGTAVVRRTYGHSYSSENRYQHHDEPVEGAELVHFGADYVFTHRDLSDEFLAGIVASDAVTYDGRASGEQCRCCGTWMTGDCWVARTERIDFACSAECAARMVARVGAA